jgi:hypothetical protein
MSSNNIFDLNSISNLKYYPIRISDGKMEKSKGFGKVKLEVEEEEKEEEEKPEEDEEEPDRIAIITIWNVLKNGIIVRCKKNRRAPSI